MVAGYLSPLLMDWTLAVTELNTSIAHKLLEKEPELLWTPIPHALDDTDHLLNELVELTKLGSSFQPVSAIQFTLLQYRENSQDSIQLDRFKFLSYLIEQSTLHDLDTRFWGECNNSTLHLVCFLDQTKLVQLLISKGVSTIPTNGLGYLPKDITTSEHIIDLLSKAPPQQQKNGSLRSKPTVVRPNYSTPDRFKLLRDLAEESSVIGDENNNKKTLLLPEILERKKSEVHYFRKGRVKETQQKVLITDEEKQKSSKRQLEVAQLAKKSAVKNNPLWKKMEKVTFVTSPIPSPSTSSTHLPRQVSLEQVVAATTVEITDTCTTPADEPLIKPKPKRNSKVISSLQKKSYVSSSIFVQADEESTVDNNNKNLIPPVPTPSPIIDPGVTTKQNLDSETQTITIYSTEPNELQEHDIQKSSSDQSSEDEDDCYFESNSNNQSEGFVHIAKQPEPTKNTYNHSRNNNEEKKLKVAPVDHTFSFSSSSNEDITNTFLSFTSNSSSEEEELLVAVNHTPISFSNNNQKEKTPLPLNRVRSFSSNEEQESNDEEEAEEIVAVSKKFIPQQPKNITVNTYNRHTMMSDEEEEEEEEYSDDEYGEATPVQFATRLISPVYKSVVIMNEEKFELPTKLTYADNSALEMKIPDTQLPVEPSSPTPVRPQRSDLRKPTSPVETPINESKEKKRMSGSQKAAWTMSMSSWAAILDREFNLDELDQQKKVKERQQSLQSEKINEEEDAAPTTIATFNYLDSKLQISDDEEEEGGMKLSFPPITSSSKSAISFQSVVDQQQSPPLSPTLSQKPLLKLSKPPQIAEIPRLNYSKSISRKPIEATLSETTITKKNITTRTVPSSRTIQVQQSRLQHGKLYLHVNGIQDILLPLPKDRAYVRCVVSDGRFEYMSRYEILSQNINFDYECVIDTHPDMIITISLHVRPDYVMKSKTPFSRLFSSKKKKESLSGYVNKEDGAIGQARFALAHMLPVCVETTYPAEFHCFNAWYSRSFKERHRQKKKDPDQDVLKVVGNFDVEMLYLPVSNYQKPFPRNLRECDAVIQGLYKSVEDSSEKYHTF
ncbi:hypothetical protein BD770DRAFT_439059 [Pilaira anomala]|nr:hypothetical protein BD770DRAFT_439059 [Pilaira anomala]